MQLTTSCFTTDTKAVYGGMPPLWVYTYMSKPLLKLRGLAGYSEMYQLSLKVALEYTNFHRGDAAGRP